MAQSPLVGHFVQTNGHSPREYSLPRLVIDGVGEGVSLEVKLLKYFVVP